MMALKLVAPALYLLQSSTSECRKFYVLCSFLVWVWGRGGHKSIRYTFLFEVFDDDYEYVIEKSTVESAWVRQR